MQQSTRTPSAHHLPSTDYPDGNILFMHPLKNFLPHFSAELSANFPEDFLRIFPRTFPAEFPVEFPADNCSAEDCAKFFSEVLMGKLLQKFLSEGLNRLLFLLLSRHHHDIPGARRLAAAVAAGTSSTSHGFTVLTPPSSSHSTKRHSQGIKPVLGSFAFTPTSVPSYTRGGSPERKKKAEKVHR